MALQSTALIFCLCREFQSQRLPGTEASRCLVFHLAAACCWSWAVCLFGPSS